MTENNTLVDSPAGAILLKALDNSKDAVFPTAHRLLREAYPDRAHLETADSYFIPWHKTDLWSISDYSADGFDSQLDLGWDSGESVQTVDPYSGWLKVTWQGHEILILGIGLQGDHCRSIRYFLVGESDEVLQGYFQEVCKLHATVEDSVLVFQEGRWYPSTDLFKSIQSASLSDLVLHGQLKDQIVSDLEQFFGQVETFEKYKLPWKRGVMFLGPPGNGKTHMIKALVNHFKLPCLYVKSFSGQHVSPQYSVFRVFHRARELAPCLLILEDLDTLLTEENRSFFLNEMDGFASNHGIVTIASCNFPEKLDAAIMERPSRFDRKYHFELPETVDRRNYLSDFMSRFDVELQLDSEGLDAVAEATHGYSFAYLKELYVSGVVRWISTSRERPLVDLLGAEAELLREQMTTAMNAESVVRPVRGSFYHPALEDDDD